jgi:hypothetical protein
LDWESIDPLVEDGSTLWANEDRCILFRAIGMPVRNASA